MNHSERLVILLGLSLLLSFFSWGRRILFPFQIFTTWVHECCHALTALFLGGESIRITLSPDGSGLTQFKIPEGRLRNAIIASSGYLGASLSGCLIFYLAMNNAHFMIVFLCVLIGLSLLFWIRNFFGILSALLLGGVLYALNYSPMNHYVHEVLLFLSIQTALNALFDIRTLFGYQSKKSNSSDAHILQKLFFLPHWCWAFAWLSLSLLMMYWTIQRTHPVIN